MADELVAIDDTTLAVLVIVAIVIFTIIQLVFLVILISIFTWLIVKQVKLRKEREMLKSRVEPHEKSNFVKRLVFVVISIPMPVFVIVVEGLTILASVTVALKVTTLAVVCLCMFAMGTFLSSTYLCFLLLYVAYMLASTVHHLKRSSVLEYRIQLALLAISFVIYFGATIISAIIAAVSLSINKYPEIYSRATIEAVYAAVLSATYTTYCIGYFVSVLVLGIGLRFYFLVVSYSKRASNQILVFLSVLIVASVVQSMGNLISQFSIFTNIFLLLFFLLQRVSEVIFLTSLVLLFIPLQQLASTTKQITAKVVQTAEKIADGVLAGKKKAGTTFGSQANILLESSTPTISNTPNTPNTPVTPSTLTAPLAESTSFVQ